MGSPLLFLRLYKKKSTALQTKYSAFLVENTGPILITVTLLQSMHGALLGELSPHSFGNNKKHHTFPCGAFPSGGEYQDRTGDLLHAIVLLLKTQCTIRYCLDSVSLNFKCIISFCFIGCQDVSFLLWSNCGQTTPTNDFSPPAKLHRAISIFINRSCAFCLHELSIRRICQPCQ